MNRLATSAQTWNEARQPGYRCRMFAFGGLPLTQLGAHLEELLPGNASCPLHYHLREEEHFYVLQGSVTIRELPPDSEAYREYTLHAGDLVAWMPGTRIAHQMINRGDAGVRFLAMSDDPGHEVCVYPDSGKTMVSGVGVGLFSAVDDLQASFAASRARSLARRVIELPDTERPSHVLAASGLPERKLSGGGFGRPLSRTVGARSAFVNLDRLPPGARTSDLHAHLADEELVYVVSGHPTLRQVRGRREGRAPVFDAPEERLRLDPGDVLHWAAGDLVAHQLLNDSDADAVLVVLGTDHPHDVCLYPDTDEVRCGILGLRSRLSRTDYWDGEAR